MFYYKRLIGKNATHLWFEINGVNSMNFMPHTVQKSISKTRSFNHEISSKREILWKKIILNVERLFEELTVQEFQLRNITLFLRNKAFETSQLSYEFEEYHCDRKSILSVLSELLTHLQVP
jgi:hypothetical protein